MGNIFLILGITLLFGTLTTPIMIVLYQAYQEEKRKKTIRERKKNKNR